MQYESNPANGFRDIVRKRNTDAQPDMVMTISPAPTSWAGDKKVFSTQLSNAKTPFDRLVQFLHSQHKMGMLLF